MNELVEYNVTDAAIEEMRKKYMSLTVKGLDDRKGFEEVHEARMIVKGKRIEVEKKRKELKADALAWGQKVDGEARRITKALAPIEEHLTTEEEKITKEKERIAAEKERQELIVARERVAALLKVEVNITIEAARAYSDEDFAAYLQNMTEIYIIKKERAAEEKRLAEEKAASEKKALEEESARLAKERAEIERLRADDSAKRKVEENRLRAEREKIELEREAIEVEKRERERIEQIEQARKEAAERAVKQAEAESKRKEELKPDKEKLMVFAAKVIITPALEFSTDEARAIFAEAEKRLASVNRYIIKAAQEL